MKLIVALSGLYKYLKPVVLLSLGFVILFYFSDFAIGQINDNGFLFQFIGILLGFAITIFQFIVSMVEKIKDNHRNEPPQQFKKIQDKINAIYKELREDITFIFISLVITSVLFVYSPIELIAKSIRAAIFCLNLLAVYDLVIVSFKVSNTTALVKEEL